MTHKVFTLNQVLNNELNDNYDAAVLCFGHFNAIHPGHIRYFQTASKRGNKLVVGLEGDEQLSDIERKEMYSETERAQALAFLDIVDCVVILDTGGLEDLVTHLMPSVLVLGKEFEGNRADKVKEAVNRTRHYSGVVI